MEQKKGPEAHDRKLTIIINGRAVAYEGKEITFQQLTALAFPQAPYGENTIYSGSYTRGPNENRQGELEVGDVLKVKDGMVFNVTATDRS